MQLPATGTRAQALLGALRSGLQPSVWSLAATLAVVGAWAVASLALVRPAVLQGLEPSVLMRAAGDDYGRLTHRVFQLAHEGWSGPTVVVVGPSTTREGVASEGRLRAQISRAAGRDVAAIDLTANALSAYEYRAILDILPAGLEGIVAVTVSPMLLGRNDDDLADRRVARPRIGWVSEAQDLELAAGGAEVPRRTGIYPLDNHYFLLARYEGPLKRLVSGTGPVTWNRHRYREPRGDPAQRQHRSQRRALLRKVAHYGPNHDDVLALLGRAFDDLAARSQDVTFVLLEMTEHPTLFEDVIGEARLAAYRADIEAYAASRPDTVYLDVNDALEGTDFTDILHVTRRAGQRRYTDALGRALGELMEAE